MVRGGILIEKRDLESGLLTPLGGASLDGTLFEITNMSRNPVYVGGALYQPGEVCATIEVKDGIAQTDARALPYGSYQLSDQRGKIIHGSKALETLDKLRELQRQLESLPEIPWEFEISQFDQLVEKIVPISNTELLFKLKCGLELKEVVPQ